MIGSTVSARRMRRKRKPVRVATSAKARPSSVESTPTRTARKKEFQATPQRGPPVRQPSDQSRSLKQPLAEGGQRVAAVSVTSAFRSICTIGMKTKSVTVATTKPIAPTTKTSPPTAPRAAMPSVSRNRKASAVSERAVAHAELAAVELAEEPLEPVELPAAQADGEALREQPGEAGGADQRRSAGRRPGRPSARFQASSGSSRMGPSGASHELLALGDEEERRRGVLVERPAVEEPARS